MAAVAASAAIGAVPGMAAAKGMAKGTDSGAASGAAGGAAGGATGARGSGLVGYPSFLPKRTLHFDGDALEIGTPTRPALTSQGDPVKVETPHWSVVATVSGPEVPGEGLPYQTPSTTCTWTVTLSKATGTVPVSLRDFDSIDSEGHVFHPALVPGESAPPPTVGAGQTVTFEMRAAETAQEGLMRWAPSGGRIVAKWDFVVEND